MKGPYKTRCHAIHADIRKPEMWVYNLDSKSSRLNVKRFSMCSKHYSGSSTGGIMHLQEA